MYFTEERNLPTQSHRERDISAHEEDEYVMPSGIRIMEEPTDSTTPRNVEHGRTTPTTPGTPVVANIYDEGHYSLPQMSVDSSAVEMVRENISASPQKCKCEITKGHISIAVVILIVSAGIGGAVFGIMHSAKGNEGNYVP